MKARTKEHFIESWKEHANVFTGLFGTAGETETIEEIKETIGELHRLVEKVADEGYNETKRRIMKSPSPG